MEARTILGFFAAALMLAVSGCTPNIGDSCTTATNCSRMGDRACDTSLPGGYCTIFNCEPDTCPTESGCVAFRQRVSSSPQCQSPDDARMIRTFCMVHCSDNSDCRGGYICADMNAADNPWGTSLVDRSNRDGRVCIVPESGPSDVAIGIAGYCQWTEEDGGSQVPPPHDASVPDAS